MVQIQDIHIGAAQPFEPFDKNNYASGQNKNKAESSSINFILFIIIEQSGNIFQDFCNCAFRNCAPDSESMALALLLRQPPILHVLPQLWHMNEWSHPLTLFRLCPAVTLRWVSLWRRLMWTWTRVSTCPGVEALLICWICKFKVTILAIMPSFPVKPFGISLCFAHLMLLN